MDLRRKLILLGRWVAALALGVNVSVSALTITPATMPQLTGTDNANLDDAQISAIVGTTVTTLYKKEVDGGAEYGPFASSYTTTFDSSDPQDALIDHIGGAAISSPNLFLYVKDGNSDPAFYIFNLNTLGWNGTDNLELDGFWPGKGAISNVRILGGSPVLTPDGGLTAALLGFGVLSLAVLRRKK